MSCLVTRRSALHFAVHEAANRPGASRVPLLLVPGLAGTTTAFPEIVSAVTRERPVITFDPPGAGLTRPHRLGFTLGDIAADAVALLDHLEVDQAHVLGISMGGMIAQELALGWPERVVSLTLGCTTCGTPHGVPPPVRSIARLVRGLALTPRVRSASDADRLFRDVLFARTTPESVRLEFFANRRRAPMGTPAGLAAQLLAVRRFSSGHRLGDVEVPTLVTTGEDDRLMPTENSVLLARGVPGSSLEILPGGHVFFTESRERFAAMLSRFHGATGM